MLKNRRITLSDVFTKKGESYLNEYHLFIALYKSIPHCIDENDINCSTACKRFAEIYKSEIEDYYFYKASDKGGKYEFGYVFFMLYGDVIVCFDHFDSRMRILFNLTPFETIETIIAWARRRRLKTTTKNTSISILVEDRFLGINTEKIKIPKQMVSITENYNNDFAEIHKIIKERLSRKNSKGLVLLHGRPGPLLLEELFDDRYLRLPQNTSSLEADIFMLDSIAMKGSGYRSFDFDGIRRYIKEAEDVKRQLNAELEQSRITLAEHDQRIYSVARENAVHAGKEKVLEDAFKSMFKQASLNENDIEIYNDLMQEISKTCNRLPFDDIKLLVLTIIKKEKEVKRRLQGFVDDDSVRKMNVFKDNAEMIGVFLDSNHVYFTEKTYLDEELNILIQACNAYLDISNEYCFVLKKDALNLQAECLGLVEQRLSTEATRGY